jgi:hypothetical protein
MNVFIEAAKKELEINPVSAEAKHLLICWDTNLPDQNKIEVI